MDKLELLRKVKLLTIYFRPANGKFDVPMLSYQEVLTLIDEQLKCSRCGYPENEHAHIENFIICPLALFKH